MLLCTGSTISHDVFHETQRKSTNTWCLLIKALFIITVIGIIVHKGQSGDIGRLINDYDDCGYTCGTYNQRQNGSDCVDNDKTTKRYLRVAKISRGNSTLLRRTCVAKPNNLTHTPTKFARAVAQDLVRNWRPVLHTCAVGFGKLVAQSDHETKIIALQPFNETGFTLVLSILMRCHVQAITWIIIISVIVLLIILSVAMWYYGFRTEAGKKARGTSKLNDKIFPAILVTFVQFTYCIAIFFLKRRIELAILLIQEAMATLRNITKLLLLPWLTTLVVVVAAALWIYLALLIESSGVRLPNGRFVKDMWTVAARWLNLMAFVWFLYFVLGCQHIIVAGAVGKWYFTREKNNITTCPVVWSTNNLFRFHLGSAATGLILILPIKTVLAVVEGCKFALRAGLPNIGGTMQCLEYLSKSAYVIVALTGSPFFRAGRDAFHIVLLSGADLVTMKTIASLTFVGGKVFQINISLLVGVLFLKNQPNVYHPEIIYLIETAIGLMIVHSFLSIYQITIETLFICLCLDCQRNDGLYRPFFMTPKLKEFLKNARALDRSPAHRGSVA